MIKSLFILYPTESATDGKRRNCLSFFKSGLQREEKSSFFICPPLPKKQKKAARSITASACTSPIQRVSEERLGWREKWDWLQRRGTSQSNRRRRRRGYKSAFRRRLGRGGYKHTYNIHRTSQRTEREENFKGTFWSRSSFVRFESRKLETGSSLSAAAMY